MGIETALLVTSVIGGVAGTVQQAQAQKKQSRAAAQAAEYNKQLAQENAALTREAAERDAEDIREDNRRRMSTIKSKFAKSGVSFSGSVLDVLDAQAAEGEKEAQKRLREGELDAEGQLAEANLQGMRAASERAAAKSAGTAGLLGAGTQLLSGAANIYRSQK